MDTKQKKVASSSNTGKIVGAAVAGAVVGAALGVLFAPDKGSETRKKIAGGAKDLTEGLKKKMNLDSNHTTEKV